MRAEKLGLASGRSGRNEVVIKEVKFSIKTGRNQLHLGSDLEPAGIECGLLENRVKDQE